MISKKQTIVFILGTPYSGSTILGNFLNASQDAIYLGEVDRLRIFKNYESEAKQYVTQSAVSLLNSQKDEFWTADFLNKLSSLEDNHMYLKILTRFQEPVIIDGSKWVSWCRRVQPLLNNFKIKVLLTVKNPFGFFNSYGLANPSISGHDIVKFYIDTYLDATRTCVFYNIPYLVINIENFMTNKNNILQIICDFVNISFDDSMLSYWKYKNISLGGNFSGYIPFLSSREKQIEPDDWKKLAAIYKIKEADLKEKFYFYINTKIGDSKNNQLGQLWMENLSFEDVDLIVSVENLLSVAFSSGYNVGDLVRQHHAYKLKVDHSALS
jgi:hypothetical protein